jgi:hypothetical protein
VITIMNICMQLQVENRLVGRVVLSQEGLSSSYVGLCMRLIKFLTNRLVHKAITLRQHGAESWVQHWILAIHGVS